MSVTSIVAAGRRLVATTFLDSCVISDRTLTRDSTGGYVQTWTERNEHEPCRFALLDDKLVKAAAGVEFGEATALLLLPLGVEIDEGDHVENLVESGLWIVTRDITPPSNLAVSIRVGIREV